MNELIYYKEDKTRDYFRQSTHATMKQQHKLFTFFHIYTHTFAAHRNLCKFQFQEKERKPKPGV